MTVCAYIKECVNVKLIDGRLSGKLADGCLLGPSCALCKWRRLGDSARPLTIKEWVRVFRGREWS